MQRDLMKELLEWRHDAKRKPLILNGARQVGKTWLLQEFGRLHFGNVAYVNLDNNEIARQLFEGDFDMNRILAGISLIAGEEILPQETLIVLDEIQAAPKAITSLKYFCEVMPEYAVAAAGSLLGISAHYGTGFPVGKVQTFDLYPLNFTEFLSAIGKENFAQLIHSGDEALLGVFGEKLEELLKLYYVVGGMPEVVSDYAENADLMRTRRIQLQILSDYSRDFTKHVPMRILQRTNEAWESVPVHLSQENKRFVFCHVREGARAKDYEESLLWLQHAGLIHRVERVSKPGVPLKAYSDNKAFKVFLLDIGLLCAMSDLDASSILEGSRVFTEFKGALTEQYVCQQLFSECGLRPFYWSADNSRGEIDFIVQVKGKVYPIEVKAEENLRARSLRAFCDRYPEMNARRFSLSGFRDEEWMKNIPLYAIGSMNAWS